MKREHVQSDGFGPWRHYGLLFWQQCIACGKDFRRESGWRLIVGPWLNGVGRNIYACASCAPTFEKAAELKNRTSDCIREISGYKT